MRNRANPEEDTQWAQKEIRDTCTKSRRIREVCTKRRYGQNAQETTDPRFSLAFLVPPVCKSGGQRVVWLVWLARPLLWATRNSHKLRKGKWIYRSALYLVLSSQLHLPNLEMHPTLSRYPLCPAKPPELLRDHSTLNKI